VCAALRAAGDRDDIAAVVLRVVSPGGSYVASDAIHREVLRLRETKPVLASMGTVAASGGYFVAMAADEIVALPGTVTGSIGVLGGKVAMGEGLRRLGVTTESVGSGSQATMFDPDRPFDDGEWRRVEQWLDAVYADFTTKAAAGRHMPLEQLEPLARGRIWTGADAHQHGLVDGLGGLELAVERAVTRTGRTREEVRVQRLPHRSPLDVLRPAESSESPASLQGPLAIASLSDGALAEPLLAAWRALGTPWTGVLSIQEPWRVS
jgi:protease IV